MKRISVANRWQNLFGPGKDGFRDGDMANGFQATDFDANWCNGVQEEILGVIEAAGLDPSGEDFTQLAQAIKALRSPAFITISSSTTWIAPKTGWYLVYGTGGGGGGSGANGSNLASTVSGAGGAAGGTFVKLLYIAKNAAYVVTIGAGGTGAANSIAGSGGATSFGPGLVASGGEGGGWSAPTSLAGGQGGQATGGDMNLTGGDGMDGQSGAWVAFGHGGASFWGGGGRAGASAGFPGKAPGSGGGGAYDSAMSGTPKTGGAGRAGVVQMLYLGA